MRSVRVDCASCDIILLWLAMAGKYIILAGNSIVGNGFR